MRIRSAGAYLALVAGMGVALAGCGQLNQVRAMKAFKDGNKLYASNDFRGAVRPSTKKPCRPIRPAS